MLTVKHYKKEELGQKQALFLGSNFLQTIFWAELKQEYGFTPYYFVLDYNNNEEGLVVLVRKVFKNISIAYIPHGPSELFCSLNSLKDLSELIKSSLPKNTLLIRYDLLQKKSLENKNLVKGLKKSSITIQVPDTTILNIEPNHETILSGMHKKTRYNIKLSGKKGVIVKEVPISFIDQWYDVYKITAERDSIAIHSKEYYKSVFNRANSATGTTMKLLVAEHEGDLLAGIFILIQNKMSTYLYGASSNIKRNLMPAYLLQWEAIQISKDLGASSYDFFGIPPTDDSSHSMSGLYRFKVGFGGEIINRLGCYDYLLTPLSQFYIFLEKLRNYYYKKIKKK